MLVYRGGSRRDDNLTPRPQDLVDEPGSAPGLSAWATLEQAVEPGAKAQAIDLDRLPLPLRGVPDRPEVGGTAGHVAITLVNAAGEVDRAALRAWADSRGTGRTHPFTQAVRDAVVDQDVRRPKT